MELVEDRHSVTTFPDVGLDGSSWERCFARLTEENGGSFSVACGKGFMRSLAEYIREHFIFVKAAGGLVSDAHDRMLLIRRFDRWDLPKGKVEAGETLAQAALRETEEETGITNIYCRNLRLKTYHIYNLYGGWHFKQTSWFDMIHSPATDDRNGNQTLVPQTEEGITDVGWYGVDQWLALLNNSYATMKVITRQVLES